MLMLLGCLSLPGLAWSETPTEFIRRTTDSILLVFRDPSMQGPAQREERLARLRHIAQAAFDWEEIARRVLGPHWHERTPQERQEFPVLFRDTLQAMYLGRLEEAAHLRLPERQAIVYGEEVVDGTRAVVKTTIASKRQWPIPLEYRVRQMDGQWRVYDVVIVGVSMVNNFRMQFHQIINQSSYQALVQQLKARQLQDLFTEPPRPSP
jgi:phospholipid transport system substrate-binding protein